MLENVVLVLKTIQYFTIFFEREEREEEEIKRRYEKKTTSQIYRETMTKNWKKLDVVMKEMKKEEEE